MTFTCNSIIWSAGPCSDQYICYHFSIKIVPQLDIQRTTEVSKDGRHANFTPLHLNPPTLFIGVSMVMLGRGGGGGRSERRVNIWRWSRKIPESEVIWSPEFWSRHLISVCLTSFINFQNEMLECGLIQEIIKTAAGIYDAIVETYPPSLHSTPTDPIPFFLVQRILEVIKTTNPLHEILIKILPFPGWVIMNMMNCYQVGYFDRGFNVPSLCRFLIIRQDCCAKFVLLSLEILSQFGDSSVRGLLL